MIIKAKITGSKPLLVHDVTRLADPSSDISKEIKVLTSKRNKTESDLQEISRLHWLGSLYYNSETGPVLPSRCVAAMLRNAAKKQKLGKTVQESVLVLDDAEIKYDGPRDVKELWADKRFSLTVPVRVGQQVVMRTRPMFTNWSLSFNVDVDETILNPQTLKEILEVGGARIGVGDWRPLYGRFVVDEFEVQK